MEARNGLITFGVFVLLFAFTFVLCLDAIATPNTTYGILALIGFVVCVAASLFNGYTSSKNGEALGIWFNIYGVVVAIAFVWYLTRWGTAFKWW
ncbi:MAG: hypothetical protein ABSF43_13280 [Rectinemataceae bacterium]|jgi:uncharacterized membrane protein